MTRLLLGAAFLAFASPAFAQSTHHSGTDYTDAPKAMDHAGMDHEGMDHADHEHAPETAAAAGDGVVSLSRTEAIDAALAAGGEPIVVKVLGAVCDFCATAMNKTVGKKDGVVATHVDLDAKTLNIVFEPGQAADDETLRKWIKKSGYKADAILRGDSLAG